LGPTMNDMICFRRRPVFLALLLLLGLLWTEVSAQEPSQNEPIDDLFTRPALLDWPGGPKEMLKEFGIGLDLSLTQFYQGVTSGDADKTWQYGGKIDAIATIDAHKLHLWRGLTVKIHQEGIYGDDANAQGAGTTLPENTAMAIPKLGGRDFETSIVVNQQFDRGFTVSLGKFNMIETASRTPLLGGGGVDTFMNTAFAAPITGVTPPYLIGGLLSVRTEPATFGLFIYDPRNAQDSDVLKSPFDDGVTFSLSTSVPIQIFGRRGFQNVRGVYSTQEGIDLRDVPQLLLPPELRNEPRKKSRYWYFSYAFQQYLFHDESDPSRGWGLFGEIGVSDGNPNPLNGHIFVGVGGNSFIPQRAEDRWGLGYFIYYLSDHLRDAAREDLGIRSDKEEEGVEAFYNLAVTQWFRLTADFQVINPFPSDKDEAFLAGLRLQTKF